VAQFGSGKQEIPEVRARTLGVGGCGCEILASAMSSLQFAKASAAMLLQQEKNNSAYVQRGRENVSGFIYAVVNKTSRRCTFGEFESLAVALRRALPHWRMFLPLATELCRPPPHQDWGRARTAGNRFARDGKEPGLSWGKQSPGERPRETAET
jgi:hypothetical protein